MGDQLPSGDAVSTTVKQCKSCPWRVDCVPDRDIPHGYSRELHAVLARTIARPGDLRPGGIRAMACHYSKIGEKFPCTGWIENQIGDGNNIGLRMAVMTGRMPMPEVDGEQHERFDDTLPRSQSKWKARR